MNARTPFTLPPHFAVDGDQLVVGGIPISQLAARVGSTPFYAIERHALNKRVALLRRHLPAGVGVHYAIKANPMPAVVCHMARLVDGLDVASCGELKLALDAGMPAADISFAGPGKRVAELAQAVAARVLIHVESLQEIATLGRVHQLCGVRPRVAVRINPDFTLKGSGMQMGGGARPFGIDAERVPQALQAIVASDLDFEGFHLFAGSQNLSAESIVRAQTASLELAQRLAREAGVSPRLINLGGGFGIPYFPGDKPLDLTPIGHNLTTLQHSLHAEHPGCKLVIELGRYLVGEAGVYVCRVVDRKLSRGQVFLVTDGGLHHHLAASGNFGQVLRRNYPVAVATRMASPACEKVSIVGPLCTPLDVLADKVDMPAAQPGDLIAVFQSGAYGLTASPRDFLSHPVALEVLV